VTTVQDEASYICDACGEEIVIPVDPSVGSSQEFVEDCPVCCRPNASGVDWLGMTCLRERCGFAWSLTRGLVGGFHRAERELTKALERVASRQMSPRQYVITLCDS
jgi:hypothetical protein